MANLGNNSTLQLKMNFESVLMGKNIWIELNLQTSPRQQTLGKI